MRRQVCLSTAFALLLLGGVSSVPAMAQSGLSGQVDEEYYVGQSGRLWGDSVHRTITLEPGRFVFSNDNLGINDRVVLTLVNPTDQPLRFETVKRLGAEQAITVPPRSTRVISFLYNRPVSDEVEYIVMVDPSAATVALEAPPVDAIPTPTAEAVPPHTTTTVTVITPEPQVIEVPVERRSAVRGYW